jgi:superfamily II DNA or RNA helicase
MKSFEGIKFKYPWRDYQARVLEQLEGHFDDERLNIVAAPGSGKTILVLEVMIRLNKPTLILSPSIAIRNQWVERFKESFLDTTSQPEWISKNIKSPKLITVSTYQGLHAAFTGEKDEEENQESIEQNNDDSLPDEDLVSNRFVKLKADAIVEKLLDEKISVIIVDEAHHLRKEWWKSLTYLKEKLENPKIVSLTATPPYDVSQFEWENFQNFCGPIDAEISVPELVKEGTLCPHQDFVYLNLPSTKETQFIEAFDKKTKEFLKKLKNNEEFIQALINHPCLINMDENIEIILRSPEYFSSIIIFLKNIKVKIPSKIVKLLTGGFKIIPRFDKEWAEILLENLLYKDEFLSKSQPELLESIIKELKLIGALEKRQVFLKENREVKKLLLESINKLDSILGIVRHEYKNLEEGLRLVILSDYIRPEYISQENLELNKLGVLPIFEKLRRHFFGTKKIGVLTGTKVIIPITAREAFEQVSEKMHIEKSHIRFKELHYDSNYLIVDIKGENNQKIVHLVTEVFSLGEIQILIGTKSLLGEGWDAPVINSLILASFVGSFMLSNQMRGRAIRIDKKNPGKISNIWHLASITQIQNTQVMIIPC